MSRDNKRIIIALSFVLLSLIILNTTSKRTEEKWFSEQVEISNASVLLMDKKYDEVKEILEKHYDNKRYENSFYLNLQMARVMYGKKDYSEAEKYYQRAYNIDYRQLLNKSFLEELQKTRDNDNENK